MTLYYSHCWHCHHRVTISHLVTNWQCPECQALNWIITRERDNPKEG